MDILDLMLGVTGIPAPIAGTSRRHPLDPEILQQPEFFSAQIVEARRFCLDLNPAPGARLAVVCGGNENCAQDYVLSRSTFPYWALEFVAQGQGRLKLAGQAHELKAGTLFTYGPDIPLEIIPGERETLVKYFVDFTGAEAEALLLRHGPVPGSVIQTSAPNDVLALFDSLIRAGLSGTPLGPQITAAILEHLILKVADTAIPAGTAGTPAFSTYRRCQRYLEEHWADLASLDQAAQECHVDPAYLCRLFTRFDHQSPYQFLLRLRMTRGAELLLTPGASVKQVAEELGFTDAFHFSRIFKKLMGLPPTQFARLRHRT
jgi:AraC-like DNA-binding protein